MGLRYVSFCAFLGGGGSRKDCHEFPFFRDVELVERSLNEQSSADSLSGKGGAQMTDILLYISTGRT